MYPSQLSHFPLFYFISFYLIFIVNNKYFIRKTEKYRKTTALGCGRIKFIATNIFF